MKKRFLAGVLWFFALAYIWNMVAFAINVSDLPGLVLGAIGGLLFALDPGGRIWVRRREHGQVSAVAAF
jgi:hypothetical protein